MQNLCVFLYAGLRTDERGAWAEKCAILLLFPAITDYVQGDRPTIIQPYASANYEYYEST